MIAQTLAALVAAIRVCTLVLEMFLWGTPRGRKAFGATAGFAAQTRVLATNQRLYGAATASHKILFIQALPGSFGTGSPAHRDLRRAGEVMAREQENFLTAFSQLVACPA